MRWFHVSPNMDPTHIATYSANPINLVINSLWWNNEPQFLQIEPIPNQDINMTEDIEKQSDHVSMTVVEMRNNRSIGGVIVCPKFGSLEKLL